MANVGSVPLLNLEVQYRNLKAEIDEAMQRVVQSADFTMGEDVREFEREFARFCGVKHAIGVGSGTDAVFLALLGCGVGPGDEVITVPNTCVSTTSPIIHCGADIVWVDIDPGSLNIDCAGIRSRITNRTKAILPVHMFGHPADMRAIQEIARDHGLLVIEDAALAVGARYEGRRVGGWGDAGCFSFHPSKIMGAYGDAGIVVTNSDEIARKIRILRSYGQPPEGNPQAKMGLGPQETRWLADGYNSRIDSLQAAILRVKLKQLDAWLDQRRTIADWYRELLVDTGAILPEESQNVEHAYHAFAIRVKNRDAVHLDLNRRGVASRIYYYPPLHLQPIYRRLHHCPGDFPVTEEVAEEILCLPMYPELTRSEVEHVAEALRQALLLIPCL